MPLSLLPILPFLPRCENNIFDWRQCDAASLQALRPESPSGAASGPPPSSVLASVGWVAAAAASTAPLFALVTNARHLKLLSSHLSSSSTYVNASESLNRGRRDGGREGQKEREIKGARTKKVLFKHSSERNISPHSPFAHTLSLARGTECPPPGRMRERMNEHAHIVMKIHSGGGRRGTAKSAPRSTFSRCPTHLGHSNPK